MSSRTSNAAQPSSATLDRLRYQHPPPPAHTQSRHLLPSGRGGALRIPRLRGQFSMPIHSHSLIVRQPSHAAGKAEGHPGIRRVGTSIDDRTSFVVVRRRSPNPIWGTWVCVHIGHLAALAQKKDSQSVMASRTVVQMATTSECRSRWLRAPATNPDKIPAISKSCWDFCFPARALSNKIKRIRL